MGNTIVIRDGMNGMRNVADLNEKYGLEETNREYSLNKKNRWELAGELKQNMSGFASDDIDVRLYETSNRNEKKSNNCISVVNSKNDEVTVKKTYANLDSLQNEFELKKTRQQGNKPVVSKKQQRQAEAVANANPGRYQKSTKKPSLNRNMNAERIVIDLNSDNEDEEEDDGRFVQYEIEYAPKKDILKYGIDIYKPSRSNKETSNKKGGLVSRSDENLEEIDYSDEEDDYYTSEGNADQVALSENKLQIDLDELINKHLVSMIQKQFVILGDQNEASRSGAVGTTVHPKDKKIYVDKKEAATGGVEQSTATLFR
jgi:hypothetical protein